MEIIWNEYDFIMSRILQPAKVGDFEIKKTTIKEGTILEMYNRSGRITHGQYTFAYPLVVLTERGRPWMSDAQLEIASVAGAVEVARGDVLIGGLGIGLLPVLIRDKVDSIDIVEKSWEVIDLVYHQIYNKKMQVIKDDIYHYLDTTEKRYDFIHIDIWGTITAPLKDIARARQKAKRCLKSDGIVWCWLQELYDRIKDKLPKEPITPTQRVAIHEPCLICGKKLRNDYAGLCMDCADDMGVSEMYMDPEQLKLIYGGGG